MLDVILAADNNISHLIIQHFFHLDDKTPCVVWLASMLLEYNDANIKMAFYILCAAVCFA